MPLTHTRGDLLSPTLQADCIVQQCNCLTSASKSLSLSIALRYTYAAVYEQRKGARSTPGTVVFAEPPLPLDGPVVACLMGQIAPGKPGVWASRYRIDRNLDTPVARLAYFEAALALLRDKIVERGWTKVAFPFGIGCGLAGGKWDDYVHILNGWASTLPIEVEVVVVQL